VVFPITFQCNILSLFLCPNSDSIPVLVTDDAYHNRSISDVLTTVYMYRVVQIWPGHLRLVYTEISPGHIWTTLYITVFRLWRRAVWYNGTFRTTSTIHISPSDHYRLWAGYTTSAHTNSCAPSEPSRWTARPFTVQSVATTVMYCQV